VLGRFRDRDAAEQLANETFNRPGYEILGVQRETPLEAARYKAGAIAFRILRIALSSLIALVVYLWLSGSWQGIGDIPLARLTLNMVLSNLFHTLAALAAAWLCWALAFGKGSPE